MRLPCSEFRVERGRDVVKGRINFAPNRLCFRNKVYKPAFDNAETRKGFRLVKQFV